MKIAQENQGMLKRLYEKKSNLNFKKMEKDFLVSRYYKKNICEFPSIEFNKKKDNSFHKVFIYKKPLYYSSRISPIQLKRNRNLSFHKIRNTKEKRDTNCDEIFNSKNFNSYNNNINCNTNIIIPSSFYKTININELGDCSIEISIQNDK